MIGQIQFRAVLSILRRSMDVLRFLFRVGLGSLFRLLGKTTGWDEFDSNK